MSGGEDTRWILSRNVLARRTHLAWSQAVLAERAGLSRPVLSAVEQGRANPSLAVLERLGTAIGLSMADLLSRSTTPVNGRPRFSRSGRRPSFERWLQHPPPGSKTASAKDFGVDLSLLKQTLSLTPEQRLERLAQGASTLAWLRKAR